MKIYVMPHTNQQQEVPVNVNLPIEKFARTL